MKKRCIYTKYIGSLMIGFVVVLSILTTTVDSIYAKTITALDAQKEFLMMLLSKTPSGQRLRILQPPTRVILSPSLLPVA